MVKGLNKEDLESKLFSYQRLLRIRTHLKTVSQVSEGHVSVESNKAESRKGWSEALGSCWGECKIALFFASLDKEVVRMWQEESSSKVNDSSKDVNLTSNLVEILRADEDLEEIY